MFTVRPADPGDGAFIEDMLVEAANWDPSRPVVSKRDVLDQATTARYAAGWPGPGDAGVIAEAEGARVGAAWYRFFREGEHGYGFISESVPELSIGVVAGWRGRGVGDLLLTALEREARRRGVTALSLSVDPGNPAVHLYRRHGYREVGQTGGSSTMRLDL